MNTVETLISQGLYCTGNPLRLHLGCGDKHLGGYINIDYGEDCHNVIVTAADFVIDLKELVFGTEEVDEIRLHHVFEHFDRVEALGMLIRWHQWLKVGGLLRIETPDVEGSAETLTSGDSLRVKMGVVRHLAGDQTAVWGYHRDQWFGDRYENTLGLLGFRDIELRRSRWAQIPYLSNIEVTAKKAENREVNSQLDISDKILWQSTVSETEEASHRIWCFRLRNFLKSGAKSWPARCLSEKDGRICNGQASTEQEMLSNQRVVSALQKTASSLPIDEIHDFNQLNRDRWIKERLPA